jgi:CRISPR-associated protein Cas2
MARKKRAESPTGLVTMWLFCMFDLPVRTKAEMRRATQFRNRLLDQGFVMKQFSVYIRSCTTLSASKNMAKKLALHIPDNGDVSFMYVTDKQYMMVDNYSGKVNVENEEEKRRDDGQMYLF